MLPGAAGALARFWSGSVLNEGIEILGPMQPSWRECHELSFGKSIFAQGRFVDFQKFERAQVENPHRLRIVEKEGPELPGAFFQFFLVAVAARIQFEQGAIGFFQIEVTGSDGLQFGAQLPFRAFGTKLAAKDRFDVSQPDEQKDRDEQVHNSNSRTARTD